MRKLYFITYDAEHIVEAAHDGRMFSSRRDAETEYAFLKGNAWYGLTLNLIAINVGTRRTRKYVSKQ